jgi:hypothetical protein
MNWTEMGASPELREIPEETRPDEGSILAKWLRTFGASAEYFKHAGSIRLRCVADSLDRATNPAIRLPRQRWLVLAGEHPN